mgnify:CR=1 FL=1
MAKKFKKGDCVILKSGGPQMTVKDYNDEDYIDDELMVDCDWFDNKNNAQNGTYHEDQLKPCPDNKPLTTFVG